MQYMINDIEPGAGPNNLLVEGCFLVCDGLTGVGVGMDGGAHITRTSERIEIRDVTIFPGHLSHWGAIKWGVFGILGLGILRRQKIVRFFTWGLK